MVCDREGDILTWRSVNAWTRPTIKSKTQTQLLDNVHGLGRSGSLLAIIGPSGSGKTTLLAILNGRFKGILNAEIRLNGQLLDPNDMAMYSGFVCQKYYVFEEMLLEEHLEFMARMKMNKNTSSEKRKQTVLKIVENLNLSRRLRVKISSLSGGQRKRLALAVQLLTNPKILFCDEPTTGLDSYIAANVVKILRLMADQGKMIICSIHQPTSDIFQMFDSVSLLASGGALAYHGPVSDISDYFLRLGFECPSAFNLGEYIVTRVTVRPQNLEGSEYDSEKVTKIVQQFNTSTECKALEKFISQAENQFKSIDDSHSKRNNISKISYFDQLSWLLWRITLLIQAHYKTEILRFILYFVVMIYIGFSYGVVEIDQVGVQNIQGLLNFIMTEIIYCSMYSAMFSFSEEIPIFLQEHADRSYSSFSYYSSKTIFVSAKTAIDTIIFTNFVFWVTGLNKTLADYILFSGPFILASCVASALGFLLSTAFESIVTASLFEVPFLDFSSIFSGFHLKLNSLPWYMIWLKYASFPYYINEALSIMQWSRYQYIECVKSNDIGCFQNGDQVLTSFGFKKENIYLDHCCLAAFVVIFHVLGFLFLLRRIKSIPSY